MLRGSLMRASSRRVSSSGLTSSQYLMRKMPDSMDRLFELRRDFEKAPGLLH
jgi:hypothetical protein